MSADALTYASLGLAALAGVSAATGSLWVAGALVLASGVLDLLDGAVARLTASESRWGALLDSTADRVSDGLPLLGLIVYFAQQGAVAVLPAGFALLGSFTVSYVRARAEALGVTLPALFMRRGERVALLAMSFLVGPVALDGWPTTSPLLFIGVAVLGALSLMGALAALLAARRMLMMPATSPVPAHGAPDAKESGQPVRHRQPAASGRTAQTTPTT